jgi:hypothetical protein
MVRRIFPSFHYERDHWRANKVRNSWVTQEDQEAAGFIDAAEWEEVKEDGEDAIREWINEQMKNTSVTTILIGEETHDRRWVNHEIEKSVNDGMGLVGIYIHQLENRDGEQCQKGPNPLSNWKIEDQGVERPLSDIFHTYDWVRDDGYENLGDWVEEAAEIVGR